MLVFHFDVTQGVFQQTANVRYKTRGEFDMDRVAGWMVLRQ